MSAPLSDEQQAATGQSATDDQQATTDDQAGDSDKGFPSDTPLADMTVDQQLAYFKHQNRQAEKKLSAFKGVTPKQFTAMQTRITELENAQLSADEKVLKEAIDTARAEATAATEALLKPQIQASVIERIAATILDEEQLQGWLAGLDPKKFIGDDGEVDKDKVMTSLTAMFGRSRQAAAGGGQRQWGQYNNAPPSGQPGSAGRAEAQRRFGTT